jgi:hypothetical protein
LDTIEFAHPTRREEPRPVDDAVEERRDLHLEGGGEPHGGAGRRLSSPRLEQADLGAVDVGAGGELLLTDVGAGSEKPDVLSEARLQPFVGIRIC